MKSPPKAIGTADVSTGTQPSGQVSARKRVTDAELLQQIAERDPSGLEALAERHGDMLRRLLGRLTGWHHDAEDLLQEVLLSVWNHAHRYRELRTDQTGTCEAWLKRLATNRVRNHYRTVNRFQRKLWRYATFGGGPQHASKHSSASTAGESELEEFDQGLAQAVRRLSMRDRTLIVLFYLEELDASEVAEIVGVRTSTVHVQLHRARQRLKKLLTAREEQGL